MKYIRDRWWARLGSNQGPDVYKTSALPLSYEPVVETHIRIDVRIAETGSFVHLMRYCRHEIRYFDEF